MSLDVYLTLPGQPSRDIGSGIFVREGGEMKEITRAEWDTAFPGRVPTVAVQDEDSESNEVYWANITHNLNQMAEAAGLLYPLWHPEDIGAATADQLINPLRAGLALLESDRQRFEQFNPSNGWGSYDALVKFTKRYLAACEEYPDATVTVSR